MTTTKTIMTIATATLIGVAGGDVFGAPEWILSGVKNPYQPAPSQYTEVEMFGLKCYVSSGTDGMLDFMPPVEQQFSAENKYLAVRYRLISRWSYAACFFSTKTVDYSHAYVTFPIVGDGKWRDAIVDMTAGQSKNFTGTITGFRLDISNPTSAGDKLWVSRVGFFKDKESATKFLAGANDRDDYSLDADLIEPTFRALIPGGTVTGAWNKADFALAKKPTPEGDGVLAVARNGEVIPSYVNKGGYAWYVADKPGKYELVRVAKDKVKPLTDEASQKLGFVTKKALPAEYFKRERLRFAAWGSNAFTGAFNRKVLEDMVECGIDLVIGHKWGAKFMQAADELGIEVFGGGMDYRSPVCGLEYIDHPCYTGDYVTDEPGSDSYPGWGKVCRDYVKNTGRIPFINLLPMYANAAQLKYGAGAAAIEYYDPDPNIFRKYCEGYCDNVDTHYICTDIYPLNWVRGHKNTYRDYVESINIIASVARERNREYWCCIQPYGWTKGKRNSNAAEFRWQTYTMMSFGCRAIHCWQYVSGSENFPALVRRNGDRTPTWYEARKAFREIKKIGDLYCTYRNLGAFTVNCTEKTPYLKMSNEYRKFDTIKSVSSKEPLLIGCFQKKSGSGTAFTVVNMTELENDLGATVRIDLGALGDRALPPVNGSAGTPCTQHGGKKATVWQKGKPRLAEADANGRITINLEGGEGVFVTVE